MGGTCQVGDVTWGLVQGGDCQGVDVLKLVSIHLSVLPLYYYQVANAFKKSNYIKQSFFFLHLAIAHIYS